MKTAYFECNSGISGDMCLGALVSAGVPVASLRRELRKVPLRGYSITSRKVRRAGIAGAVKVDVKVTAPKRPARRYSDVRKIISSSALPPSIKDKGMEIFTSLFRAEAGAHGEAYDKVHLHELGAVDCMVDVLGTLVCLEKLGIGSVLASPINLGSGTVNTEHGELPVPAPATAELLRGVPVYSSGHPFELTTPTGAAIIRAIASGFGSMPLMRADAVGTGAGGRELKDRPNVLRVFVGEAGGREEEEVVVIEANVDDMNPQIYGYVMERLLKEGALDVFLTPIIMKKTRPAVKLSVLCDEDRRLRLTDIVLSETTTLGVRFYRAGRSVLERSTRKVQTEFGPIRVKEAVHGGSVKAHPEYDDVRRAAKRHGVPVAEVIRKTLKSI